MDPLSFRKRSVGVPSPTLAADLLHSLLPRPALVAIGAPRRSTHPCPLPSPLRGRPQGQKGLLFLVLLLLLGVLRVSLGPLHLGEELLQLVRLEVRRQEIVAEGRGRRGGKPSAAEGPARGAAEASPAGRALLLLPPTRSSKALRCHAATRGTGTARWWSIPLPAGARIGPYCTPPAGVTRAAGLPKPGKATVAQLPLLGVTYPQLVASSSGITIPCKCPPNMFPCAHKRGRCGVCVFSAAVCCCCCYGARAPRPLQTPFCD